MKTSTEPSPTATQIGALRLHSALQEGCNTNVPPTEMRAHDADPHKRAGAGRGARLALEASLLVDFLAAAAVHQLLEHARRCTVQP